jgi:hypothetical protein
VLAPGEPLAYTRRGRITRDSDTSGSGSCRPKNRLHRGVEFSTGCAGRMHPRTVPGDASTLRTGLRFAYRRFSHDSNPLPLSGPATKSRSVISIRQAFFRRWVGGISRSRSAVCRALHLDHGLPLNERLVESVCRPAAVCEAGKLPQVEYMKQRHLRPIGR